MLPALPAGFASTLFGGDLFGSLSGSAGPSQSGDANTGSTQVGGISPVVIGGFKSNGEAKADSALGTGIPSWVLITGAVLAGVFVLSKVLKK